MTDREHGVKAVAVACGVAALTLGGLFLLNAGEQGPVGYEDRDIPLFRTALTQETIPIRFYDDQPSIAYVKIEDYHHLFLPEDQVTVEETADGSCVYNVANSGGSAVIDTAKETIRSDDLLAFVNVMGLVQPGMPNAYLDGLAYCRWSRREASPAKAPVELDLEGYGIDLRADESGLYLPVATLSDLYSDLAYHYAFYCNGKVYVEDENKEASYIDRDSEFLEQYMAVDPIPEDLAAFNYGELCFAIDTFYGLPERVELDDSIREKGLDRTLEEYGEEGVRIRELLRSTEKGEYLYGLNCIGGLLADGGHTSIIASYYGSAMTQTMYDKYLEARSTGLARDKIKAYFNDVFKFYNNINARKQLRDAAYGEGVTYVKKGNTAVCIFDSFGDTYFDEVEAYINGEADELPQDDPMRIFKEALDQAKADPEVENFIVDITNNGGGSLDILVAMAAMLTGENEAGITFTNMLTGQSITDYYQIDCNLDGKFDDADKIPCDLRVGVLTSSGSFSCGNLFPSVMKEKGAMILGEQSGGGCCAIQNMAAADVEAHGSIFDQLPHLEEQNEEDHHPPVLFVGADLHMLFHGNRLFCLRKVHRLLRDALPGKEILEQNTDSRDQRKHNRKQSPVRVRFCHIQRGPVIREHIPLQQDRNQNTCSDSGCSDHRSIGHGRQKSPLFGIPCRKRHH